MSPRIVVAPDTPTLGHFSLVTFWGNHVGTRMIAGDDGAEAPGGVVVPSLPPAEGYATEQEARQEAMLWNLYVRAVAGRKKKKSLNNY